MTWDLQKPASNKVMGPTISRSYLLTYFSKTIKAKINDLPHLNTSVLMLKESNSRTYHRNESIRVPKMELIGKLNEKAAMAIKMIIFS